MKKTYHIITLKRLVVLLFFTISPFQVFSLNKSNITTTQKEGPEIYYSIELSEKTKIEWNKSRAVFYENGKKPIVIYEGGSDQSKDNCDYSFEGKILSIIGHYVSYSTWSSMSCPDARGPYILSSNYFKNLNSNKNILLQEIFPLNTFLEDFLIESEIDLGRLNTIEDKMEQLKENKQWQNKLFTSYLFDHLKGDKVFVKVYEPASYGRDSGELEKYLQLPLNLKKDFHDAERRGALYKQLSKLSFPPKLTCDKKTGVYSAEICIKNLAPIQGNSSSFKIENINFIDANATINFYNRNINHPEKCADNCNDLIGVLSQRNGQHILLSVYKAGISTPSIESIFSYDVDGDSKNELVIQTKWIQEKKRKKKEHYDVYVYDNFTKKIDNKLKKVIPYEKIIRYLNQNDLRTEEETRITQYRTPKEIKQKIEAIKKQLVKSKKLNKKGEIEYKKRNYRKSIIHFKDSIKVDPRNYFAYSNLGVAYQRVKKFENAIKANKKAIQYSHEDNVTAASHYNLGRIYEKMGKWKVALKHYKIALKYRNHPAYKRGIKRVEKK